MVSDRTSISYFNFITPNTLFMIHVRPHQANMDLQKTDLNIIYWTHVVDMQTMIIKSKGTIFGRK